MTLSELRIEMLVKFWIIFDEADCRNLTRLGLGLGAGVTAYNESDALALLRSHLKIDDLPQVERFVRDIKFDDLEENHVRRNMSSMSERGVWYPRR